MTTQSGKADTAQGVGESEPITAWRTDSPPYGSRPIWQYVFIQGEQYHSGQTWARAGWGIAGIRTNDAPDGYAGYRKSDIERICSVWGMDFCLCPVVVGWLPMVPPALITESPLPALDPCDDGEWSASARAAIALATKEPAQ